MSHEIETQVKDLISTKSVNGSVLLFINRFISPCTVFLGREEALQLAAALVSAAKEID